ncbi:MAG TPA: hypothetical protein VG079_03835, partial [Gaiellaceae bacterium]|nr:hypothetical protein [Gaiellaceae bacterium]
RIQVRSPTEPGSSKVDSKTAIDTGSLCFEDNSYGPPSLRMGSRGFLGACADDSIALEALRRHLADGREPPERFRGERGNVEFLATIVEAITRAEAEERGLFETPEHGADIARERKPSQSRDDPIATKTLARLRARTGTRVTLNNRESAAVFREGGALWFVTETTLVSVTGPVRGDARALAASLRAV